MAGATYKILVEQTQTRKPTQAGVRSPNAPSSSPASGKPKVGKENDSDVSLKAVAKIMAITGKAMDEYFTITGQQAKANEMKAVKNLGLAAISAGVVGLNPLIGLTIGAAYKYYNFQKDIAEENSMAYYLREQSEPAIQGGRGDYYRFQLF